MTRMTEPDCAVMSSLIHIYTQTHAHTHSVDGNGDEDGNGNGNEDRIGKGGEEAKKRKKPHKSCRRHGGNGGDLDGKRKERRK